MRAPRYPVEELLSEVIDDRFKGIPSRTPPFALRDIGKHGWSIVDGDLPLPLMIANTSAVEHNIGRMQRYFDDHGVRLAPHGKTTMAPQLFRRQIDAGAWAIAAATIEQLAIYRRYGIDRIILANQVAGAGNLRMLGDELSRSPDLELLVFVDSVTGVEDRSHRTELRSGATHRCSLRGRLCPRAHGCARPYEP
jgi:D-serine dehydratase